MERLTDRRTAAELKKNAELLQESEIDIPMSAKRYIKLAEYENAEEGAVWDPIDGEFICSNCGGDAPLNAYRMHKVLTKFCPHCGRFMKRW